MKKTIFTFLVVLLASASIISLNAEETAIPYLPQLDNFGGASVDVATFVPSVIGVDHTLEVGANGNEINVAGMYKYAPAGSGTVRFAQKGSLVYVYENNVYKTALTTTTPIQFPAIFEAVDNSDGKTGIYDVLNLLKDPGFEDYMEAEAQADYTRWLPYAWILADYQEGRFNYSRVNFRPSGGTFGETLVNEIEGNGAFMLHSYAESNYFAQEIPQGTLEEDNYYLIKFKVWSHNDGGGEVMKLKVGTGVDLADIAESSFTIPTTNHTALVVSYYFKMTSANASNSVYITIAHSSTSGRKLEHFDRMTMVKAASNELPLGITGVTTATYLEEKAYAPQFDLPANTYFDMTSYIQNPNFDSGNTGWTTTTGASARGTFTAETKTDLPSAEGVGYGDFRGGVWENWNSSAIEGKMYQIVNDLPNGKYLLKATVMANKTWEDIGLGDPEEEWLVLYGNEEETYIDQPRHIKTYSVETLVSNGSLEMGINIKQSLANWFAIDNFSLAYYGFDSSSAEIYLQNLITVAEALTGKIAINTKNELDAAVAAAQVALGVSTKEALEIATERLNTAMAAANASLETYGALKTAIDDANVNKESYVAFGGYTVFVAAIATANEVYNAATANDEEVNEAIEALHRADVVCRLTQPTPFDATFTIANPSFENGTYKRTGQNHNSPVNWSLDLLPLTASGYDIKMGTSFAEGAYNYNVYGIFEEIDLYQDLTLPKGLYRLQAQMYGEEGFINEPQAVYVSLDGGVTKEFSDNYIFMAAPEHWVPLTVTFRVEDSNVPVRIGAYSAGTGIDRTGWFRVDNFTLEALEVFSGLTHAKNDISMKIYNTKGGVNIVTDKKTDIAVFSIAGQLIRSVQVDGGIFIPLNSGVYIINGVKAVVL